MRRTILGLLVGFTMLSGSQAIAVDFPNGFYAGGTGGVAEQTDFCQLTPSSNFCKDDDFAWKLFGGYQFVKWFSIEAGYADHG